MPLLLMHVLLPNLHRLRVALHRLLYLAYPVGFCAACQRETEWRDSGATFVCRSCGLDPLFHAPAGAAS
ncbi:MAG TPA: hypothetical protein VD948_08415 [Rhodothermales bacterium]|nr:hypothetical protein [Rhodothermales bacterium]